MTGATAGTTAGTTVMENANPAASSSSSSSSTSSSTSSAGGTSPSGTGGAISGSCSSGQFPVTINTGDGTTWYWSKDWDMSGQEATDVLCMEYNHSGRFQFSAVNKFNGNGTLLEYNLASSGDAMTTSIDISTVTGYSVSLQCTTDADAAQTTIGGKTNLWSQGDCPNKDQVNAYGVCTNDLGGFTSITATTQVDKFFQVDDYCNFWNCGDGATPGTTSGPQADPYLAFDSTKYKLTCEVNAGVPAGGASDSSQGDSTSQQSQPQS
ncbi:MAG: hypothetical protein Q9162_004629 [Coniocarpon cinnabarinum]